MNLYFTVPGRPVPAVRMTQRGKYLDKSQRYLAYKEAVGWKAKEAMGSRKPTEEHLLVEIWFYIAGRKICDIDNLAKSIMDGMNKIVYLDDKQVVDLVVHRRGSDNERAEVFVKRQPRVEVEIRGMG